MSEEKGNDDVFLADLAKLGVYVKAKRASDNVNKETDKEGSGKDLERFYPKLDGNDTIGKLRAAAKLHFYTDKEHYIFYDKDTKNVVKDDDTLIKDIAVITEIDSKEETDEKKEEKDNKDAPAQKITIYAEKVYPTEEPGDTADAANKLVEEVTELDTKAFYAVGSMDGCQIVLDNILTLLNTVFADVNKDPLLQTLVTIAKHDNSHDKETIEANKIAMKKLLLEMGAYKKSEIEKVSQILGLVLAGLTVAEGLKWGVKKAYKRVTKNRQVYEGPATKWKTRFNKVKSWGKKTFSAGMKFAKAALDVASIGLTIYGIAAEKEMEKKHWKQVCEQLIEQKKKRYDEYEDIYSRYNDLSDTMWMLRHQFVTNFKQQCTTALLNDVGDKPPTVTAMSSEGDKVLKTLIQEVSYTLTNVYNYLYGLVKDYTKVDTAMPFIEQFMGEEVVKNVEGYNKFIASEEKKLKKVKKQLSDKQKARYVDVYALYLLDKYFQVLDESGLDKILPYDKDLRGIMGEFPTNENAMFGEKDAPLKKYVQQMRMTFLWFDGANKNSDSTGGSDNKPVVNKAVVTFSFAEKVQKLYDKENKQKK
eukprot:152779_1